MSFSENQYPEGTFKMCPNFIDFNKTACRNLSNRYSKHNTHRSQWITKCCNETINELINLNPKLLNHHGTHIVFDEQTKILISSIKEMDYQINKTSTVQAHKCKSLITSYEAFKKKATNKQDQNSWKVSGEYFFVPYIYSFIKFIKQRMIPMINDNNNNGDIEQIRREFIKLGGIIFAVKLLKCKVKFERAKEKPLIRDRTLVLSGPLHEAFRKLHPMLNVPKFYLLEKAKKKKIKKKIVSADFHNNISEFCEYLLQIQRKAVMNPNMINTDIMEQIAEKYNFPKDWLCDDNNNDDDRDMDQDENEDDDADENKSEPQQDVVDDHIYDYNIPPPISWQHDNNNNNNNNYNHNVQSKDEMETDEEIADNNSIEFSEDGTVNSDSTANTASFTYTPFNVIQTRHDNNNNGNNMYKNTFRGNKYGGDNNMNNVNNVNSNNIHGLRVDINSNRAFQKMPNFAVHTGGINKGPNVSPDSTKYERKYRNDRELYIQDLRNNHNHNHHHQRPAPSIRSYNSHDSYRNQQQSQRVEPRLPRYDSNTQSVPFEVSAMNYNYGQNDQSSVTSTAPSTPSTPTLPPKPPKPARYNPMNINTQSIDRQNDNNTGNESVISEPISIFPDYQNLPKLGVGIPLPKFEFQISSPGTLCPMGSDTVMMGGINTNEMGFSYNN